uniref:Plant heme peroxidase family profile domain-containing protein n=1 Tax=Oryza glumipatula TaxID=40148 RepID=A0A0D9Y752_9ORYZ
MAPGSGAPPPGALRWTVDTLNTRRAFDVKYNFYGSSCPNAEQTISNVVYGLIDADPSMAPALLRLHFHDCFVML